MSITATELKSQLLPPDQDKLAIVNALFGSIPADITLEEAREERLNELRL